MKGRKTKYKPELVEKICNMIEADNFTIQEICKSVGIVVSTYFRWLDEKKEFKDAIKKAEANRPENLLKYARNGHRKLLEGFEIREVKTVTKNLKVGKDAQGVDIYKPIKLEEVITIKEVAPNPTMVIFTQKALDRERYGENIEPEPDQQNQPISFNFILDSEKHKPKADD